MFSFRPLSFFRRQAFQRLGLPGSITALALVAVLTILAVVVAPIYNDRVMRSNRAHARSALLDAVQWMERTPLKYLGSKQFDANFDLIAATNPHSEWDSVTGVFNRNPQLGHADYGDQGYGQSGAITYINGFSALDPDALGTTKDWDPLSELYYEAFRYLQGQQPTPLATAGLSGTSASDRSLAENFPAYLTWTDPFSGFKDNTGEGRSWRVYADIDRDMAYTAGTDVLVVEEGPAPDGVMNNGEEDDGLDDRGTVKDGYLMFNPAGFPRTSTDGALGGSVVFYLPEGRATAVVYSNSGRIRRCDPSKTGCRT